MKYLSDTKPLGHHLSVLFFTRFLNVYSGDFRQPGKESNRTFDENESIKLILPSFLWFTIRNKQTHKYCWHAANWFRAASKLFASRIPVKSSIIERSKKTLLFVIVKLSWGVLLADIALFSNVQNSKPYLSLWLFTQHLNACLKRLI